MTSQCTFFDIPKPDRTATNAKRKWENAFQRWSDQHAIEDDATDLGKCGYGSMCEWCGDNSYGRPCVRALNAMCRERGVIIDYATQDFESLWVKGVSNGRNISFDTR